RSGIGAVDDSDLDVARLRWRCRFMSIQAIAKQIGSFGVGKEARVEIDEHAGVSGMQVLDTADTFKRAGCAGDFAVHIERDLFPENEVERAVARGTDRHFRTMVA